MFSVGIVELVAIFVVALLLLGPKDLLDLSKTIARFIGEIKNIADEVSKSFNFRITESKKTLNKKVSTIDEDITKKDLKNV